MLYMGKKWYKVMMWEMNILVYIFPVFFWTLGWSFSHNFFFFLCVCMCVCVCVCVCVPKMTKGLSQPNRRSRINIVCWNCPMYVQKELTYHMLLICSVTRCEVYWEECNLGLGDLVAEKDPGVADNSWMLSIHSMFSFKIYLVSTKAVSDFFCLTYNP